MTDSERPGGRTLSEKLEHLFRTVRPASRGEYSFEEVASAIRDRGGPTISASYIWQLRKGIRDNPTKKHLEALADFFGVPPSYFFDDRAAAEIDAQLDLLAALRDASVRDMALRAAGLSAESIDAIRETIERLRKLEGLRDGGEQPPRGGLGQDEERGT